LPLNCPLRTLVAFTAIKALQEDVRVGPIGPDAQARRHCRCSRAKGESREPKAHARSCCASRRAPLPWGIAGRPLFRPDQDSNFAARTAACVRLSRPSFSSMLDT